MCRPSWARIRTKDPSWCLLWSWPSMGPGNRGTKSRNPTYLLAGKQAGAMFGRPNLCFLGRRDLRRLSMYMLALPSTYVTQRKEDPHQTACLANCSCLCGILRRIGCVGMNEGEWQPAPAISFPPRVPVPVQASGAPMPAALKWIAMTNL